MFRQLERGSSPVDWCESNYSFSPLIAEFVNTISNVLFFVIPPVLINLFHDYSKFFNPAINVLWSLYIIVGLSSAYFHATLSLAGQLLDELTILWAAVLAIAMFFPKRYFPRSIGKSRKLFSMYLFVFSFVSTGFLLMYPAANAFALMTIFLPTLFTLSLQLSRVKCERVYRLGIRSSIVCLVAVFCWVIDRLFCDAWRSINFPYLHGIWHVLSFLGSYGCAVAFAYFCVYEETPEQKPELRYWPKNNFELGIPYVVLKRPYKKDTNLDI